MKLTDKPILLLTWMLALCLSGCTAEDISGSGSSGDGGGVSDGNRFLSLTVDLTDGSGGTKVYIGDYAAWDNELMVSEAMLVIYSDGVVRYARTLDATNVGPGNSLGVFTGDDVLLSRDPYSFQAKVMDMEGPDFVDLSVGNLSLLVVLNPSAAIKDVLRKGISTIADLETAVDYNEADFIGENGDRFLMTNAQGLVPLNKAFNFHKTEDAAQRSPLNVFLLRAVSKVTICLYGMNAELARALYEPPAYMEMEDHLPYYYDTTDGVAYKTVLAARTADMRWGVNVTNKKSYWLRRMTLDANGEMEKYSFTGVDPFTMYAEDPNFEGYSVLANGTPQARAANFNYMADGSRVDLQFAPLDEYDGPVIESLNRINYAYIPENTMARGDQYSFIDNGSYGDVATSVTVGTRMQLYKVGNTPISDPANLLEEHLFMCEAWLDYNYYMERSDIVLGTRVEADRYLRSVYQTLRDGQELRSTLSMSYYEGQPHNFYYPAPASLDKAAALVPAVEYLVSKGWDGTGDIDWDNMPSFTAGTFRFFNRGQMYYNAPIVQFDYNWDYFDKPYYSYGENGYGLGVVRNNFYVIEMSPFVASGPGTVTPEVPGTRLNTAKVRVNPWNTVSSTYDVGSPPIPSTL